VTDSGTGIEASLFGVVGMKVGWVEGAEVNFLGLGPRPAPSRSEAARVRPHRRHGRYGGRGSCALIEPWARLRVSRWLGAFGLAHSIWRIRFGKFAGGASGDCNRPMRRREAADLCA
jgi:hypothetical protein